MRPQKCAYERNRNACWTSMNPDYCHGCGDEVRLDIRISETITYECIQCGFQTRYDKTGKMYYKTKYSKKGWNTFNFHSGYLFIAKEEII